MVAVNTAVVLALTAFLGKLCGFFAKGLFKDILAFLPHPSTRIIEVGDYRIDIRGSLTLCHAAFEYLRQYGGDWNSCPVAMLDCFLRRELNKAIVDHIPFQQRGIFQTHSRLVANQKEIQPLLACLCRDLQYLLSHIRFQRLMGCFRDGG